jgi:hypothetical protein
MFSSEGKMNKKLSGIFWGIILIAGGIYALAQSMGYKPTQEPALWAFIFGGISVVALVLYFIDGVKNWAWLFPIGVFAGLAIMLGLVASGMDSPAMAAPLFIGIGVPFVVVYFFDRPRNWWALIPAAVMAFLTLVLFAVDNVPGEWIGSGFLFIIALAFFVVYLSRRAFWAILVAYIMFVLSLVPVITMTTRSDVVGALMLFAISLPFLYVYVKSPTRWWAIIPAGILLTLGIVTAVMLLIGSAPKAVGDRIANAITFAGTAATFGILWWRQHLRWALVVAILTGLAAIAGAIFGNVDQSWPILVIIGGAYLLYTAFVRKPA